MRSRSKCSARAGLRRLADRRGTARSLLDDDSVKSPDFLVVGPTDVRLVVDVKGRKFGGTAEKPRRIWQNWCNRDDVTSLESWTEHLAPASMAYWHSSINSRPSSNCAGHARCVSIPRHSLSRSRRGSERLSRRDENA